MGIPCLRRRNCQQKMTMKQPLLEGVVDLAVDNVENLGRKDETQCLIELHYKEDWSQTQN